MLHKKNESLAYLRDFIALMLFDVVFANKNQLNVRCLCGKMARRTSPSRNHLLCVHILAESIELHHYFKLINKISGMAR